MDSTSENRGSKYHFVIYTGASTTDPKARKLAKQDVMQHIRRNRTNPQVARRYVPLQCELDVPQTFNQSHGRLSEQLNLSTNKLYLASVDGLDVPSDLTPRMSPRTLSVAHGSLRRIPLHRFSMPGLGAGRSDPFIKFPTELNSRSRELVDLSQYFAQDFLLLNYRRTNAVFSIRGTFRQGKPTGGCMVSNWHA